MRRFNAAQKHSKTSSNEVREVRTALDTKMNEIERRSREYSIRIKSVDQSNVMKAAGDYRRLVAEILVVNKVLTEDPEDVVEQLEIAHPLGPAINGKQNIIARFYSRPYRNMILRGVKGKRQLIGAQKITEDLTKLDMDLKRKLSQR